MSVKLQQRIPFQLIDPSFTPFKRSNKVIKNKLPADFFGEDIKNQRTHKMTNSTLVTRNSEMQSRSVSRNSMKEQFPLDFGSKFLRSRNFSKVSNQRQSYTARENCEEDKDLDLIRGIIKTNRQMRKMIRKHSVELKRQESRDRQSSKYQCRQFYGKRMDDELELPPLVLRKGLTTAF